MGTLRAQVVAGPCRHHDQRGDAHLQENGVIAHARILASRGRKGSRFGCSYRLCGGAHALIAFRAGERSATATRPRTTWRRTCSSSTKLVASKSAPMATCATVVLTMLGSGCTAFLP